MFTKKHKVKYANHDIILKIKDFNLKLNQTTFDYNDIITYGYNNSVYVFKLENGLTYTLYTKNAKKIYDDIYSKCIKIYKNLPKRKEISNSEGIRASLLTYN